MKSNHIRVSAFFSVLFCLTAPAISQNTEIPSKPGSEHHISRDRGDNCPLGDVKIITKISQTEGNFTQALSSSDGFGMDIDTLGDFNHDGVMDFVVCATFDDDGASNAGAVYILFMNANGTVLSSKKISSTAGGFTGSLGSTVQFGASVSNIGDLDGDGTVDIAVGANQIDDGAHDMGAIFIIFLKPDGTVKSNQRISSQSGNFMGVLSVDARFGSEIENLGDTDGDGITDLAVGAHTDNPGGAFFIVRLNANGTVKNSIKITDGSNGFSGPLASGDYFGYSITKIGDLDHDGTFDLAVSAFGDDDGASTAGAVWILFMNPDMTVKSNQKISASSGGFTGTLISNSRFGRGLTAVRDVDSDTYPDIAVGENGQNRIWILTMNSNGTVKNAVPVDNT
ncbi:MAG: integrin alpha, partial [Bacteroidetes bacterium]|nr:integrin alpha [Bacteroidota bacterium]